ncbi:MAG: hypothetical protein Q8R24_09785, partial [Legionellaceae bacterium]|nr:hypothetical protein [Legionellaceae bacterium]
LTLNNRDALQTTWKLLCEEGVFDSTLNALDVPKRTQEEFIGYLTDKYRSQFVEQPELKHFIEKTFRLTPVFQAHAVRFAAETGLEALLNPEETQNHRATSITEFKVPCYHFLLQMSTALALLSLALFVVASLACAGWYRFT